MFSCIDCKNHRRNDEKSYGTGDGFTCRSCVNSLEKYADMLNAIWNPYNTKRRKC